MRNLINILLCFLLFYSIGNAQSIKRSVISSYGSSSSLTNIILESTLGQPSNIGTISDGNNYLRQGFQQPIYNLITNNECSDTSFTNITACDSILWDGIRYDTSGTYYSQFEMNNNYSINFDGINDDINIQGLFNPSEFTVGFWIKTNSSSSIQQVFRINFNNGQYFLLDINPNGEWYTSYSGGSVLNNNVFSDNSWHYITIKYFNGELYHYIDSSLTLQTNIGLWNTNSTLSSEIKIGVGTNYYMSGNIDEFCIWDIALSDQEIQEYMLCSPAGSENGIIGYWDFEEGSGNTVFDQTSNGNNGTINGATYDTNIPTQSCQLTNSSGCDSVAVLNLTINQSDTSYTNITACDSYLWLGTTYTVSGIYDSLFTNINGYTNNYTNWDNSEPNNAGCNILGSANYAQMQSNGSWHDWCDDTSLSPHYVLEIDSLLSTSVSNNYILLGNLNNSYYYLSNDTTTWTNANNLCITDGGNLLVIEDSTENYIIHSWIDLQYSSGGAWYTWIGFNDVNTEGQWEWVINNSINGCDSLVILDLTINNSDTTTNAVNSCDSYTWDGVTYNSTGQYTNTYSSLSGCDSIVTLDLMINQSDTSYTNITACDSVVWNGTTYTQSGIYNYNGQINNNYSMSFDGIDDYITVNNNLGSVSEMSISVWANIQSTSIGPKDLIGNWNGGNSSFLLSYEGATQEMTFITLGTSVSFPLSNNDFNSWINISISYDGSIISIYKNGTLMNTSFANGLIPQGSPIITFGTEENLNYCQSHWNNCSFEGFLDEIQIWNTALTQQEIQEYMNCSPTGSEIGLVGYWNFEEGTGNTVFDQTLNGNNGTIFGAIYDSNIPLQSCQLTNSNGCDSVVVLNLTINQSDTSYTNITACDSIQWNGEWYDSSGTYYYSGNNINNLFSMDFDGMNMDQYAESIDPSNVIFQGVNDFTVEVWYKNPSVTTGPNSNIGDNCAIVTNYRRRNGGDPFNNFNLDLNSNITSNPGFVSFPGGVLSNFSIDDNQWHHIAGVYDKTNQMSYLYIDGILHDSGFNNGDDVTGSTNNIRFNNLAPFAGDFHYDCSVSSIRISDDVRYTSSFVPCAFFADTSTLAFWDFSNPSGNMILDGSGNNYDLQLYNSPSLSLDSFSCQINSNLLTNSNGCDSVAVLNLTINNSQNSSVSITACDSYFWDGVVYDTSGQYTNTYSSLSGCDSIVTVDLTINNSTSFIDTIVACGSFNFNSVILTNQGTYSDTLINLNGCDSIITIDLTFGIYGCINPLAFNYDSLATCDDGSCIPIIYGCLDTNAVNYYPGANIDDSSCIYAGCMDTLASNYDSLATIDDGSCIYLNIGCTDSLACNYDPLADLDDGSCLTDYGCMNSNALNYDSLATCSNDSCIFPIYGCTDTNAVNYYAGANVDDGGCLYAGCTDTLALNYDSIAFFDDGSCIYPQPCPSPKPTGLYAYDVIDTRAKIGWDNMNDSLCMVLKYFVRYRELGTNPWITKSAGIGNGLCNFGLNTVIKQLLNLSAATTYEFKMKAFYCGGTSSNYSPTVQFTTLDVCPDMTNLTATTFNGNQSKVRFNWDTTGAYTFARILLRVDTSSANWQTAGGFGVYYPTFFVNKFGLTPGQSYRAQGRTFCDSNITAYRSPTWTAPIFWTQPGNLPIRFQGGVSIEDLVIYPNPSRDLFNISFVSEEIQDLSIRIINMVGAEIYRENKEQFIGEYTKQISLNEYGKGVYFLEIETSNGIINKKLVLQ